MATESVAITLAERDRLGELMANAIAVADLLQSAGERDAEVPGKTLAQVTYMLRNQLQEAYAQLLQSRAMRNGGECSIDRARAALTQSILSDMTNKRTTKPGAQSPGDRERCP